MTLAAWWRVIRPQTLWAGAIPIAVGTAVAAAAGVFAPWTALAALVTAIALQIGTNLANDYSDFVRGADGPDRLGPSRACQAGWVSPARVRNVAAGVFGISALSGLYLVSLGGWPIALLGALSLLAGVAYTGGPWPLGYHGLGELLVWLFFGLVGVGGAAYLQTGGWSPWALGAGAAIGALAAAILVVNNLRDRPTDAACGKRTLAVRFGAPFARVEYGALLAIAYLIPLLAWGYGRAGWLLPWLTAPLAWRLLQAVRTSDGRALNPHLGATARLEAAFGVLLAVGVLL